MIVRLNNSQYRPNRVFCIGRNYAAHVAELSNEIPESPVVFLKPPDCLVSEGEPLHYPPHGEDLQHEAEIVLLIGKSGRATTEAEAENFIAGVTLGLDLTLRDVQSQLKKKGLPWEKAKAFEQSAPIGEFISPDKNMDLTNLEISCSVNGELRQRGNTALMLFPIRRIIVELSKIWRLVEGDIVYTGTPAGVGPLRIGDRIEIASPPIGKFSWEIVE